MSEAHSEMSPIAVEQMTCARIPTDIGVFQLCFYQTNLDAKEHLALVMGDVTNKDDVLVRVHSECFTGDVLGSLRCDCGPQLSCAMQLIAKEEAGVIIYLRQEGRGIGLLDKLRSYNLQDAGLDTVEANLQLGHQPDGRDYTVAALILKDLQVSSIRLMTNNPEKIESLRKFGIQVSDRVPLQTGVNQENLAYLRAKAEKMRHILDLDFLSVKELSKGDSHPHSDGKKYPVYEQKRPFITLTYAQSLDGSIAQKRGEQLVISGPESLELTHRLRSEHDAILVGIGTVLADDPQLTTRLIPGHDPQPVILDSRLRFPTTARLLKNQKKPWIYTTDQANYAKEEVLTKTGAKIIRLDADAAGHIGLQALMQSLVNNGIESVMVEGGSEIITSFLEAKLVDRLVITIAPVLIGGINPVQSRQPAGQFKLPSLINPRYELIGDDMVFIGDVV